MYGVTTVFSRILGFFLTPLYTLAYPAKVYGIFTLLYSYVSILNPILAFGMETTFFRYLNKHENDRQKVYNNSFVVILCLSLVFLAFALLFSNAIGQWLQGDDSTASNDYAAYIRYPIYILVIDGISVIPFAIIRANGRPLRYGLIKMINILTFVGFNLFFILAIPAIIKNGGVLASYFTSWYQEAWIGYVLISNLIASTITLLLLTPELFTIRLRADLSLIKNMLAYSFPILIANLSFIINENLDKILLKELLPGNSIQEVGIYGACCKIALFLSIFINAFRLGAEPFFFSHAKNKDSGETYAKVMNYFVIAIALIFVGLVANIELLKYFINGRNLQERDLFWSGLKVVPVLLLGYVSLGIYMNLSIWYKLSDQTRYGLYFSGIGAIVTIVMNILFIPEYGYIASAWISLAAYSTMMVLSYVLGQKNYPIPYNLKKILAYLSVSVAFVILSFNVFNRDLIAGNILLFLFIAGAFYIERKEIKAIFNENQSN